MAQLEDVVTLQDSWDSGAAVRHSPSAADTEALRPTQTCQFRHTDLTLLSQRWDLFPSLSGSPARAAPRSDTEAPRPTQVPPSDTAPPRPTAATALGAGRHGTWRDTALGAGRLAHPAAADTPTPPADSPRPTQTLSLMPAFNLGSK